MLGIYVTVPLACFRVGHAREYWETHPLPPPSTCYGFLLSLVGEIDRERHIGCRVTAARLGEPELSVVLRTFWRVKNKNNPQGVDDNKSPGHQQLLSHSELILWVDSSEESHAGDRLEERIAMALNPQERKRISRFGGLSLGESTHLVSTVSVLDSALRERLRERQQQILMYRTGPQGMLTLPVWVDHVGSANTRYVVGDLVESDIRSDPNLAEMPRIQPKDNES